MSRKLLIFPFNGNGIEALDCLGREDYDFFGFIDDDPSKSSDLYTVHSRSILETSDEFYVLAVPGGPASFSKRSEYINSLHVSPDRYATIIHPNASVGKNVKIGKNCLIMAGVVLTSNSVIGDHVCILPNTVVHHDTVIGDYTLIGSNVAIAGGCNVGKNCYIGSGSNIMNGLQIGDFSLVGLGSNVIRNTGPKAKVAGNPAKELHKT